jgi:hypothetical protein
MRIKALRTTPDQDTGPSSGEAAWWFTLIFSR